MLSGSVAERVFVLTALVAVLAAAQATTPPALWIEGRSVGRSFNQSFMSDITKNWPSGTPSPNNLAYPVGVAAWRNGPLWVLERWNQRMVWNQSAVMGQPDLVSNSWGISDRLYHDPAFLLRTVDGTGIYVADTGNRRVLYHPVDLASGQALPALKVWGQPSMTTADVVATSASTLGRPLGLAIDATSSVLWVSDASAHRIVGFSLLAASPRALFSGIAATRLIGQANFSADTPLPPSAGTLNTPAGLAVDLYNNLWVCDSGNHRVLRFPPGSTLADFVIGQDGFVTAIPGTGTTRLDTPWALAFSPSSRQLFISEIGNRRVLRHTRIAREDDFVQDFGYGDGSWTISPTFLMPCYGVTVDDADNVIIADTDAHRVLGYSSLVVGVATGGALPTSPYSSILVPAGESLILNFRSLVLARNLLVRGTLTTLAGSDIVIRGDAVLSGLFRLDVATRFQVQGEVAVAPGAAFTPRITTFPDPELSILSAQVTSAQGVRGISSHVVTAATVAFRHSECFSFGPFQLIPSADVLELRATLAWLCGAPPSAHSVYGQLSFTSSAVASAPSATAIRTPHGIAVDAQGRLVVAELSWNRVSLWNSTSAATNVWGPATTGSIPSTSSIRNPSDVALFGDRIAIADTGNNRVVVYDYPAHNGAPPLATYAFTSEPSSSVFRALASPFGVEYDVNGTLWVADTNNHRILGFPLSNATTAPRTLRGNIYLLGQASLDLGVTPTVPSASVFGFPRDLCFDVFGAMYVVDSMFHRVLVFPPGSDTATRVLGQLSMTSFGNPLISPLPSATTLFFPRRVVVSPVTGHLYVAQSSSFDPNGNVPNLDGRVSRFPYGQNTADLIYGQWLPNATGSTSMQTPVTRRRLSDVLGIALDASGNLYVSDPSGSRVLRFGGSVLTQLTADAPIASVMDGPVMLSNNSALLLTQPLTINGDLTVAGSLVLAPGSSLTVTGSLLVTGFFNSSAPVSVGATLFVAPGSTFALVVTPSNGASSVTVVVFSYGAYEGGELRLASVTSTSDCFVLGPPVQTIGASSLTVTMSVAPTGTGACSSGLPTAALIGIIVGACVFAIAVVAAVVGVLLRRRRNQRVLRQMAAQIETSQRAMQTLHDDVR